MRKLLVSCVALGALAGAAVTHPAIAGALEAIWLTEDDLDRVTGGLTIDNITIVDSATWTEVTTLPGGTAVTSTTISCSPSCTASVSSTSAGSSSVIVTTAPQ